MDETLKIITNPLLKHKLGYLRDKNTCSHDFREIVKEISKILISLANSSDNLCSLSKTETISKICCLSIVLKSTAWAIELTNKFGSSF